MRRVSLLYLALIVMLVIVSCSSSRSTASLVAPISEIVDTGPYDFDTVVLTKSGLTAEQLNKPLAGTWEAGLGEAALSAEQATGINALLILAHVRAEVGSTLSQIARTKNNIFGLCPPEDQNDTCTVTAYSNFSLSIQDYARLIRVDLLSPGGRFYCGGTTIAKVFNRFSASHLELAAIVVKNMNDFRAKAVA